MLNATGSSFAEVAKVLMLFFKAVTERKWILKSALYSFNSAWECAKSGVDLVLPRLTCV